MSPSPFCILPYFNELTDYRPSLSTLTLVGLTCTGRYWANVAAHTLEARLKGESLGFHRKDRVSRRAGVIDSCLLTVGKRASAPLYKNELRPIVYHYINYI